MTAFMQSRCAKSDGIAFVGSTPLCVCENIRIPRHKTFDGVVGRGKSSTGWFFGFKLLLVVNERGGLVSFYLTSSNEDDRIGRTQYDSPWAKKNPSLGLGSGVGRLAIPYFRMANCHTIIGAKRFHFR
ncbi:MAG: transposase, partial [Methylovulum sp.]|nr:transposase [Methylovulum sp.]